MLDHAANASVYWDAGRLRSGFESRFDSAEAATGEFTDFIEGEVDADELWDTVAANLEERRRVAYVSTTKAIDSEAPSTTSGTKTSRA
jgi:superfamily I DNA/RNA helicase